MSSLVAVVKLIAVASQVRLVVLFEVGTGYPNRVKDHGELSRDSHLRFSIAATPRDA